MFKKLFVPSEEHVVLDAHDAYVVEWTSRYGKYFSDTEQAFQVFTTKEDADVYAKAITEAFALIQYTSGTSVKVYPTTKGNK
jgi:hypothetical protein